MYDIAIVPLIVAFVEMLKQVGLPKKFSALVSTLLGAFVGVIYISPDNIGRGIVIGLALGLAATGLYSGTKSTIEGYKIVRAKKFRKK